MSRIQPSHEKFQKSGRLESTLEPFELILKNSVDGVFKHILGEGGAQALKYHLKLGEHSENPKEFHDRLASIMKDGALVLESLVIKDLFRAIGLQYEEAQFFDFGEHVARARKSYESIGVRGAAMQ